MKELNRYIEQLSNDIAKRQDQWVLETLSKHGVHLPEKYTHMDLLMAINEYKVEFKRDREKIGVFVDNMIVGEWYTNYETNIENNTYSLKIKCWN